MRESQLRLERDLADSQQLQRINAEIIHDEFEAESIYDRLVDAARAVAHAHGSKIQMVRDGDGSERRHPAAHRGARTGARAELHWAIVGPDSPTAAAGTSRGGGRVVVADVADAELADSDDLDIYLDSGIRSVQATPLLSRSGKLLGVLSTHWDHAHVLLGS